MDHRQAYLDELAKVAWQFDVVEALEGAKALPHYVVYEDDPTHFMSISVHHLIGHGHSVVPFHPWGWRYREVLSVAAKALPPSGGKMKQTIALRACTQHPW